MDIDNEEEVAEHQFCPACGNQVTHGRDAKLLRYCSGCGRKTYQPEDFAGDDKTLEACKARGDDEEKVRGIPMPDGVLRFDPLEMQRGLAQVMKQRNESWDEAKALEARVVELEEELARVKITDVSGNVVTQEQVNDLRGEALDARLSALRAFEHATSRPTLLKVGEEWINPDQVLRVSLSPGASSKSGTPLVHQSDGKVAIPGFTRAQVVLILNREPVPEEGGSLQSAIDYVEKHHPLPRCSHGNALRDHAGVRLVPSCGCQEASDGE